MLKNIASPRNENIHLRKLSNSSYLYNGKAIGSFIYIKLFYKNRSGYSK